MNLQYGGSSVISISNADISGNGMTGLRINRGATIDNCTIRSNGGHGVHLYYGTGTTSIANTDVSSNGEHGIVLNESKLTLIHSSVNNNGDTGINNTAAEGSICLNNSSLSGNCKYAIRAYCEIHMMGNAKIAQNNTVYLPRSASRPLNGSITIDSKLTYSDVAAVVGVEDFSVSEKSKYRYLYIPAGLAQVNQFLPSDNGYHFELGADRWGTLVKGAPAPPVTTYALTVTNGTGGGSYVAGAKATITANAAPAGQVFDKWTGGSGGTFANASSASTTFTMPAKAATVTATYKPIGNPVSVTKIDTPMKTVYIQKGRSLTIPCVIYDGAKEIKAPLTWTSSNESIAKVTQSGKVTIPNTVKKGSATITAEAGGKKLSVKVVVSDKAVKLKSAKVSAPSSLKVGKSKKLAITLAQKNATGLAVTFKSSKASGLYVDKAGLLTAKAKGKYTITIKVGTVTVKKTVNVTK